MAENEEFIGSLKVFIFIYLFISWLYFLVLKITCFKHNNVYSTKKPTSIKTFS